MRQIVVTAGVIVDEQGRVLIAQRRPGAHAALLWEFPGGRLEVGEHPEAGLTRELLEELDMAVTELHLYDVVSHVYKQADLHVILLVYSGRLHRLQEHTPRAVECAAFTWVYPFELSTYTFSAADAPLVHRLQLEGVPCQGGT